MNAVISGNSNWEALLDLKFRWSEDKTRLVPVRRYGPLSVQRPFYPEQQVCHTYLLHPPGGVVGGDRLDLKIHCEPHVSALVTTPGATKFYHSAQHSARVNQKLRLDASSSLEFLPQENIYFPGALVNAHTEVLVDEDSSLLLWEKHCFGRPVNGESFDKGRLKTRLDIIQHQQLVFSETQRIDHDEIKRASGLRNNPVMGTLAILSARLDKSLIETCRQVKYSDGIAGITQPIESLLLVRYMGSSTRVLNSYFVELWEQIRVGVMHRSPCHPRIWNT